MTTRPAMRLAWPTLRAKCSSFKTMCIKKEQSVSGILARDLSKATVLNRFGINYWTKAKRTLAEACAEDGADTDELIDALSSVEKSLGYERNVYMWSLRFLIDFILNIHHKFVDDKAPLIIQLAGKCAGNYADIYPEIKEIAEKSVLLAEDLQMHIRKEERILFPAILALEKQPGMTLPFGSIENPVNVMRYEHDQAGRWMEELTERTSNFQLPDGAGNTLAVFYNELKVFLDDLKMHMYLENNILFERAAEL